MMQRIRAVAVVLAMAAGALALANPATATAAPAVDAVRVNPNPIVVSGGAVKATFTVITSNAATAELQIKAPGIGAPTSLKLEPAPHGQKTRWTATTEFDRESPAGRWSLLAIAHGDKDASDDQKGSFRVVQVRDSRVVGFDASPEPVKKGADLTFRGALLVGGGDDWDGFRGQRVAILFKADGSRKWEFVTGDRTDHRGRFWAKAEAEESGWWKAVYAGRPGVKGDSGRPDYVKVVQPAEKADTRVSLDAFYEPAKRGKDLRFKGRLQVNDNGDWEGFKAPVKLFFKPLGSDRYRFVKTVWTDEDGRFFTKSKVWRSGFWKVFYSGDEETKGSASARDFVRVKR